MYPMHATKRKLVRPHRRIVEICADKNLIGLHIFANHIIRQAAADIESMTLSKRIEDRTVMPTKRATGCFVDDITGTGFYILTKKVTHADTPYKTHAHRFFFVSRPKSPFSGHFPYLLADARPATVLVPGVQLLCGTGKNQGNGQTSR